MCSIEGNHKSENFDGLVEYCAQLEALAGRYIYEAHHQSLDGLDICEHDAGICFCSYHGALRRLLEVLTTSPLKRSPNGLTKKYDGYLDNIGNDFIWTQKLQILNSELLATKARYDLLKELTRDLIASEEILSLKHNGATKWQDRLSFEDLLERIEVHTRF
jgi:hypothetical protein